MADAELSKKPLETMLLKRLLPYIGKYAWLGIGALVCLVIVDAAGVLQPYLVKHAIDADVARRDLPGLARTGVLLALAMVAGYVFQVISGYGIQYLGQRLLLDLRMDLFRKVLSLSSDFFDGPGGKHPDEPLQRPGSAAGVHCRRHCQCGG